MRSDLVTAVKALLTATGAFSKVCGLSSEKPAYPLARVWYQAGPKNKEFNPEAFVEAFVLVQIETNIAQDTNGDSVDGTLYDLADAAFDALFGQQIGTGCRALVVYDDPGWTGFRSVANPGEVTPTAKYVLTVGVNVLAANFTAT